MWQIPTEDGKGRLWRGREEGMSKRKGQELTKEKREKEYDRSRDGR